MARECRLAGVHVGLPRADVNSNPASPVVDSRSFGEDPSSCQGCRCIFYKDTRRRRSTVCCKSIFPTIAIPMSISQGFAESVDHSRERLDSMDLARFQK